jgi:3'(2'),5'-bisphosphate nucleotidase
MNPDPAAYLPTARGLALEAGECVMALLREPLTRERKADKSLVTNADHASNDILRAGLRKAFPGHRVLSEETGLEGPASGDVWLIDPLDGTKAYAKGITGFSVMVGLLRDGRPVLGVVYDPLEGHLYEGVVGEGAFHSRVPVAGSAVPAEPRRRATVSGRSASAENPVIVSTGFPDGLRDRFAAKWGSSFLEPVNSVGVKVGYLVRGLADVYLNHHPVHFWDTCGPLAVLQAAGGVMTHWDGSPLAYPMDSDFRHPGPTLATNGPRHAEISAFLSALPTA